MVSVTGQQQQLFVVLDFRLQGAFDSAQLVVEAHPLLLCVFGFGFGFGFSFRSGLGQGSVGVRVSIRVRVRVGVGVSVGVGVGIRARVVFDIVIVAMP